MKDLVNIVDRLMAGHILTESLMNDYMNENEYDYIWEIDTDN